MHEREKKHIQNFIRKPEREAPLRRWWKNNIKIELTRIKCKVVFWVNPAQDRDQ
jgi:hypothetical protein